jgi:hypothetical protein
MIHRLETKGDLAKLAIALQFNKKGRTPTIGI